MLILAVTCHRSCNFMSKMENQILATYGYEYTNSMTNHIFGGLFQRLAAEKFLSWSWWGTVAEQQSYPCSLLGTRHPDLITAVLRQLDTWWVRRVLTERARLQCLLSDSHSLWVSLVRVRNIGLDKKKNPHICCYFVNYLKCYLDSLQNSVTTAHSRWEWKNYFVHPLSLNPFC